MDIHFIPMDIGQVHHVDIKNLGHVLEVADHLSVAKPICLVDTDVSTTIISTVDENVDQEVASVKVRSEMCT